jgi:hypothetical protein
LHFTPTRASWLNQVEIWFSILEGKSLHGASFTELCGNLGDDDRLKAAYRGGCQSLLEPPERSDTPCREIPLSFPSVSLTSLTIL